LDKIGRIKELVSILQKASYAYYGLDGSVKKFVFLEKNTSFLVRISI